MSERRGGQGVVGSSGYSGSKARGGGEHSLSLDVAKGRLVDVGTPCFDLLGTFHAVLVRLIVESSKTMTQEPAKEDSKEEILDKLLINSVWAMNIPNR